MAKVRVLLLLHQLDLTGAPKVALDAFEELQSSVELMTVTHRNGELAERAEQLGELHFLMNYAIPNSASFLPAQLAYGVKRIVSKCKWKKLSRTIARWKPDVIYVNSVASLPIATYLSLPSVPTILHIHELDSSLSNYDRKYGALLRRWPRKYIAVSEAVKRALMGNYEVSAPQIALIHGFVRTKDFCASASNPTIRRDPRFTVGGAGSPSWHKGIESWLFIANEVKKLLGAECVRFVWVGLRDDFGGWQFREMARKLDLESCVEFVPCTTRPLDYFAQYDIFALTSWEDSCPIVVLENMMLEKPVLCFAGGGGAPEEVGDTGVVIEGFSSEAMARAVVQLAASPERRLAMGKAARARVGKNFTSSRQAAKIFDEIEELARAKPS